MLVEEKATCRIPCELAGDSTPKKTGSESCQSLFVSKSKDKILSYTQKNDAEAVLVREGCIFVGYDHEKGI